jgi:tetratricopeptide (TPR) repeat protein
MTKVSSGKTRVTVTCGFCGRRIKMKAWILINVEERWDLVREAGRNRMNEFRCGACNVTTIPHSPIVLFFPDTQTPFLFSPWSSQDQESHRRELDWANTAVRTLLKHQWQQTWLADGMLVVLRPQLVDIIRNDSPIRLREFAVRQATEVWLRRLLEVDEIDEEPVVEAHGELLEPLATTILEEWTQEKLAEGKKDLANYYEAYGKLLTQCRTNGFKATFQQRSLDRLARRLHNLVIQGDLSTELKEELFVTCQAIVEIAEESNPLLSAAAHGYWGFRLDRRLPEAVATHLSIAVESAELQASSPEDFRTFLTVYCDAVSRSLHTENMEQAIELVGIVRERSKQIGDFETEACASLELVRLFVTRRQGDPACNLEQAIENGKRAREYFTLDRSRGHWARATQFLSTAYFRRVKEDRASNIETAISLAREVLAKLHADELPATRASVHGNLGNFFANRQREGEESNFTLALQHYESALQYYQRDQFPDDWARNQFNIGHLFLKVPNGISFESDDIETAIGYLERSIEIRTEAHAPEWWALTKLNLATAYGRRVKGDPEENSTESIKHAEDALRVFQRDRFPLRWANAQVALAGAHLNCRRQEGPIVITVSPAELPPKRVVAGIGRLRRALLEMTALRAPDDFIHLQLTIGDICFWRSQWKHAHNAYAAAFAAGEERLRIAFTDEGRRNAVTQESGAYARDAYCLYHLGDADGAFALMDRGKVRLLDEWLTPSSKASAPGSVALDESIEDLRHQLQSLSAEMRDAAERNDDQAWLTHSEALRMTREKWRDSKAQVAMSREPEAAAQPTVAPLVTEAGTLVFFLRPGNKAIEQGDVIEIPAFHSDLLLRGSPPVMLRFCGGEPIFGWWLLESEKEQWPERVRRAASELGILLMSHVREHLRQIGVPVGAPVTFLPNRGLGLLPVHAATMPDDGKAFLDDYVVSFAQSFASVARETREFSVSDPPSVIAAINPTSDLGYAALEWQMVVERFGAGCTQMRSGGDATAQWVLENAPGKTYLHFACHGFFSWGDAWRSGLTLAGGDRLTLATVMRELDLRGTRLVVLSACNSGQIEAQEAPEEFIGLQTAFLRAGAKGVICSLWPVDDISTALLMDRFYEAHLGGSGPAPALQDAQLWLRRATAGELADRLMERRATATESNPALSSAWRRFVARPPEELAFPEPYFWAPFTFYGE